SLNLTTDAAQALFASNPQAMFMLLAQNPHLKITIGNESKAQSVEGTSVKQESNPLDQPGEGESAWVSLAKSKADFAPRKVIEVAPRPKHQWEKAKQNNKVKMCPHWKEGNCRYSKKDCYFAHGEEDMKYPYKVNMCFNMTGTGKCPSSYKESRCRRECES